MNDDFADGFGLGYALGSSGKKGSGSGGGSEIENIKWERPKDWLPMPDPDDNGFNILLVKNPLSSSSTYYTVLVAFSEPEKITNGCSAIIDWGDGTEEEYVSETNLGFNQSHTYLNAAQFVIVKVKIKTVDIYEGDIFCGIATGYINRIEPVEIFLGKNVCINKNSNNIPNTIVHIKYFGWKPKEKNETLPFRSNQTLCCVDTVEPWSIIPDRAFLSCSALSDFDFSKAEYIGMAAFAGTSIRKVEAPLCIEMGNQAFGSILSLIYVSANQNEIVGQQCFYGSHLSYIFMDNLKNVGASAFLGTRIEKADFPNVEEINVASVFSDCFALRKVNLPKCVSLSGASIFYNSTGLQEVSIPECLEVGANCFAKCFAMSDIEYNENATFATNSLYSCDILTIKYPELSKYNNYN